MAIPLLPVNAGEHALISTLGGKPQVVTFALDWLLAAGASITHVYAVHLSARDARIQRALDKLEAVLQQYDLPRRIKLESIPIRAPRHTAAAASLALGRPIEQIDDPAAANAIWLTMHRLISTLKSNGAQIELCLAGGPRLISLQALSVATLLFTPPDRCWHLYTPEDLRAQAGEGQIMHLGADSGMRLIAVPFVPMGVIFPNLQSAMYLSPQEIIAERTQRLSDLELQRCRTVMRLSTPGERKVLQAFACGPVEMSVKDMAAQLHLAPSTVNTHKTVILRHCRNEWALPEAQRLTHHFLRDKFGPLPAGFWEEWVGDWAGDHGT